MASIDLEKDADKQIIAQSAYPAHPEAVSEETLNAFYLNKKTNTSSTVKPIPQPSKVVVAPPAPPVIEQMIEAYIGAELYSQRMFPYGCPSFQKA